MAALDAPPDAGPEEFLEYPRDSTYLISTHGRCFSIKSNRFLTATQHRGRDRPRHAYVWSMQMPATKPRTQDHRVRTTVPCAVAVWRTFVGPIGAGYTVRPIDDDPAHFHLDNLHVVNSMTGLSLDYHQQRRPEAGPDAAGRAAIADQLDQTAQLLAALGQRYLSGRLYALARRYDGP